jgi:hypothetical protein
MLCLLGDFAIALDLFPAAPFVAVVAFFFPAPPDFDLACAAEPELPAFFLTTGFFAAGLAVVAESSPGPD